MNGMKPRTPRSENSNGIAPRLIATRSGIARPETCEPSSLMDWPAQSLTKSGCFQRLPLSVGLRIVGLRAPHARCHRPGLPAGHVGCAEVRHQLLHAAVEPVEVLLGEPRPDEAEPAHERRL